MDSKKIIWECIKWVQNYNNGVWPKDHWIKLSDRLDANLWFGAMDNEPHITVCPVVDEEVLTSHGINIL
jgi:hypothetical protein